MKYSEAVIKDGKIEETNTRTISQSKLTCECWEVQFKGLTACKTCEFKDNKECGGKNIRKTKKNSNGFEVPL